MNPNLINWIDNHWDIIRSNAFSYDMKTFKNHVTTELNSLGIFSLTINATLIIKLICISNLLSLRNIVLALSPLFHIVFTLMSTAIIIIGFYSKQHSSYTTIPTWSSILLIFAGFLLTIVGASSFYSSVWFNRKIMKVNNIALFICFLLLVGACFGSFMISQTVSDSINSNWPEIYRSLKDSGFMVRKSFLLNQIQINLKFAGLYALIFAFFSFLSIITNLYIYIHIGNEGSQYGEEKKALSPNEKI